MDQLQPTPLHTQADNRPSVLSKVSSTLLGTVVLVFAIVSTRLIWADPDMEMLLRLTLSTVVLAFTLVTLAALAGGRQ